MKKKKRKDSRFAPIRLIGDIIFLGVIYFLANGMDSYYSHSMGTVLFIVFFGYIIIRIWEMVRGGLW